jgi:hypothetical protein
VFKPNKPMAGQESDPKYSIVMLFETDSDLSLLKSAAQDAVKAKWGDNIPKGLKLALRKGDEDGKEDVDGYGPEVMFISSNSRKKFPVVDRDPSVLLSEEDGKPYAGCYVNVLLRFWAQDNEYGRRVNAQPLAIQFVRDGQPFGEAPVNPEEAFGKVEGGDEESPLGGGDEESPLGGGDDSGGRLLG